MTISFEIAINSALHHVEADSKIKMWLLEALKCVLVSSGGYTNPKLQHSDQNASLFESPLANGNEMAAMGSGDDDVTMLQNAHDVRTEAGSSWVFCVLLALLVEPVPVSVLVLLWKLELFLLSVVIVLTMVKVIIKTLFQDSIMTITLLMNVVMG